MISSLIISRDYYTQADDARLGFCLSSLPFVPIGILLVVCGGCRKATASSAHIYGGMAGYH